MMERGRPIGIVLIGIFYIFTALTAVNAYGIFVIGGALILTQRPYTRYLAVCMSSYMIINELIGTFSTRMDQTVFSGNAVIAIVIVILNLGIIYFLTRPAIKEKFLKQAQ